MGIFGSRSVVGVEIDAYEARVIEMSGTVAVPRLLRIGRKALPAGTVKDGKLLKPEQLTVVLSALWQELNIRTREVLLGVNNQDVIVRFANFPRVAPDKMDNLIRYQAQEFLPIPVNDVELDYVIIGEEKQGDTPRVKVLLVAAKRNMIYEFLNSFEAANLKVRDIDMSTLAIARLLSTADQKSTCALVNVGYEQTNILILHGSNPQLARSLMTDQDAGENFEEGLQNLYQRIKLGSLTEEKTERIFNSIAGEIMASINYFQSQSSGTAIERIYLCGCGSRMRNCVQKLNEYAGIPIEVVEPYKKVDLTAVKSRIDINEAGDFSVSVSLALRGLEV
jgi:type IV pilus assembly protein PilM